MNLARAAGEQGHGTTPDTLRGEATVSPADQAVALEIGRRLRRRRRHMGATLSEIGRRAGVSYQQLQRLECGETQISAAMVWRLAGALGVTVDDLFGEPPAPTPNTAAANDDSRGPQPPAAG